MYPLLTLGEHTVRAYGLLVILGTVIGTVWARARYEDIRGPEETDLHFWTLIYALVLGALVGGKLGFFIVEWRDFLAHPVARLVRLNNGWVYWFAITGSMAGGWLYQQWFNRRHRTKRRYLPIADYIITALPMGHWLGRVGCFLNGCCHGRPTDLPWGVRFTHRASAVPDAFLNVPLHPTQLYEAGCELALALFLALHVLPGIRRGRYAYGTAFFGYILLYSGMRFWVEFLRGDDRGVLLWPVLSPSQWYSLAGMLIAAVMLRRNGVRERAPEGRSPFYS
ncbi:MAG: hypothetical protein A2X36_01675 [Elusimicrobia bacterium GWA2_69_24]|nr:MAG: hypothetical protein A2X36_01675 [Elusimicrobia bacterium GWA2_69_24]